MDDSEKGTRCVLTLIKDLGKIMLQVFMRDSTYISSLTIVRSLQGICLCTSYEIRSRFERLVSIESKPRNKSWLLETIESELNRGHSQYVLLNNSK
jgi:hypothetical protein